MKKSRFVLYMVIVVMFCSLSLNALGAEENWVSKLSSDEFQALQTYKITDYSIFQEIPAEESQRDFPDVWDWRGMSGVTSVKNQAACGSCWAFAALGVLEAKIYIDTGIEYDLSEQQMVDCTPGCYGCNGGMTETAWSYLQWEPARVEVDYVYEAENGDCRAKNYPAYIRTTGYDAYYNPSEEDIKTLLTDYGPLATSMGANDNLKAYSGGCYADDANTGINHGVVIVGWDDNVCDGGSWIVKNSWGQGFGEDGYFYIRRGDVHLGDYVSQVYYEILPAVAFDVNQTIFADINGITPEAGSTASLDFAVRNIGRETATNVQATLSTTSTDVTIVNDSIALADLAVNELIDITDAFEIQMTSTAAAGMVIEFNVTITSDNGESIVPVKMLVGPLFPFYSNDFEGDSDEGWTHAADGKDHWTRGMHGETDFPRFDPELPYSGDNMWGVRLNKSGNYPANKETWLYSPVFDCSDHTRIIMRFKRWLSVEKSQYDHAWIQVNGQEIWENPFPTDLIDTSWVDVIVDVTEYLNAESTLQVTFGLETDGGLEFGGWNIDDFQILSAKEPGFDATFEDRMDLTLGMPDRQLELNDTFTLYSECRNYGPDRQIMEFVALEIAEQFWFWPSWSETLDYVETTVGEEQCLINTVLTFTWPEIEGTADGLRFWLAALEPDFGAALDYDVIEWGW